MRMPLGSQNGKPGHHEDLHLLADLAVVALLGLREQGEVLVHLLLVAEGDAVDAGEHLVLAVALPVRARDARQLERLERLRIQDVRAHAHVHVLALLVERDARVLGKVADVLDLVLLAALLHVLDGLRARELVRLELEVLLADLAHLVLDGREVVLRDLRALGELDVVVEAVVRGGAVREVRLGVQALDCLRHDVRRGVAKDVELLVSRDLVHVAVVVKNLHAYNLSCVGWARHGHRPQTLPCNYFRLDQGRRARAPGRGPGVNAARRLPQDGAWPSHRKDRRLDSRRSGGGNTVRDGATRARAWAEPVLVTVRTHDLTTPPCRDGTTCVCRRPLQQLRAICGRDLGVSQKPHARAQGRPRDAGRSGTAATKRAPRLARCP